MKLFKFCGKSFALICSILTIAGFAFSSCRTVNPDVPTDLTPREIIQKAQNAYNDGNSKLARYYYDVLISRYGMDTTTYIEGKYEIAHIYVKAKDWNNAVPILDEIKSLYDHSLPGSFPGEYLKMVENDLAKVPSEKLDSIRKKAGEN